MSHLTTNDTATRELLERMIAARQLSPLDAQAFAKLGAVAVNATEDAVLRWLATEYDVSFTALDAVEPDRQVLSLFPARVLLKEHLLPLRRTNGVVEIATSRLFATQGLDALKAMTGLSLTPVLAPSEAIEREMKKHLGVGADTIGTLNEEAGLEVVQEGIADDDLDSAAEDASIIRFVNQVLRDAIELRASDVHLEPFEDEFRIRYRIDGVLKEIASLDAGLLAPLTSRLKIMAGLDIAEKRKPQDGRISIKSRGRDIDVRTSVLPGSHGETIVMRLLDKERGLMSLEALGFDGVDRDRFERVIARPNGIVLVTGPTGSGKTTTLYAALQQLNRPDVKIITAEDPVEFNLRGINQCQVKARIGLSFARILRAMLRQAPNVILVGEIRDRETAEIAVQAALTGHLVFSTLHTNDAPSAITRLCDMGVKPFLVAASVQAVLAQRLVRVVCKECREPMVPSDVELRSIGIDPAGMPANTTIYRAVGCQSCEHTGYRGRIGIYEMMAMDEGLREMTFRGEPMVRLREYAFHSAGMSTLSQDGARKVMSGRTTIQELLRVTAAV